MSQGVVRLICFNVPAVATEPVRIHHDRAAEETALIDLQSPYGRTVALHPVAGQSCVHVLACFLTTTERVR